MSTIKRISIVLGFVLVAFTAAQAIDVNVNIGTGGYYNPVGNYDYLPYAYATDPSFAAPRINFYDMMSDYGAWRSVAPFGQAWQPYVAQGWRPYTYGHWSYTSQYGPMWNGYEPWAWAGYHYGNWIMSQQYGWVWIPGYQYHAGQVQWGTGYDSIGWMPLPPTGYDYSRGYLGPAAGFNQFGCQDDFSVGVNLGGIGIGFGTPYTDPRCQNMYYNQGYLGAAPNLWTFINGSDFGYDNYADYYLTPDYTRSLFDTRIIRVTSRPLDRPTLERITRVQIQEVPVIEKQIQTDKQTIRVVVPSDEQEIQRVRKHSTETVQEVIAPAFIKNQKSFKGETATGKDAVAKVFKEDLSNPRVEKFDAQQGLARAEQAKQQRDQRRAQKAEVATQKLQQAKKEGKIKEPKGQGARQNRVEPGAESNNVPENAETERGRKHNENIPPEEQTVKEKGKKTSPGEETPEEQTSKGKQKRSTVPGETTPEEPAARDREKKSNAPGETTPDVEEQRTKRNQEETVEPGNEAGAQETNTEASQNEKTDKSADKDKKSDEKAKGKKKTDKDKDKDKKDEQP